MAAGVAMARSEKILDVEGASMLHLRELQVLCTSGECQNMSKAVQQRTDHSPRKDGRLSVWHAAAIVSSDGS